MTTQQKGQSGRNVGQRIAIFIATALLFALALYLMACLWFAMIGHRIRSYEAPPEPIIQRLPGDAQ